MFVIYQQSMLSPPLPVKLDPSYLKAKKQTKKKHHLICASWVKLIRSDPAGEVQLWWPCNLRWRSSG